MADRLGFSSTEISKQNYGFAGPAIGRNDASAAAEVGSVRLQLIATIEGQTKVEDGLRGILSHTRGAAPSATPSHASPSLDSLPLSELAEMTTRYGNSIAELVGELDRYI